MMLTGAISFAAEPLRDFVGPVGMYGHMNDILVENMAMFKAFAEGAELADVQTARAEDRAAMAEDSKAFWEEFWVRRRTLAERLTRRYWACIAAQAYTAMINGRQCSGAFLAASDEQGRFAACLLLSLLRVWKLERSLACCWCRACCCVNACLSRAQRERKQLEAMAEAQNWEGEEEQPPEPTEAQQRAAERAEEVRRTRKVRWQDIFIEYKGRSWCW